MEGVLEVVALLTLQPRKAVINLLREVAVLVPAHPVQAGQRVLITIILAIIMAQYRGEEIELVLGVE